MKEKTVYGFDTFEGLPEADSVHHKGQYAADFHYVKNKLSSFRNVKLIKGLFENTKKNIENEKFAFVHIDVDINKFVKECLEFFYPRMSPGGLLVCHDYSEHDNTKGMIDGFVNDKRAVLVPLAGSQCLIVGLN